MISIRVRKHSIFNDFSNRLKVHILSQPLSFFGLNLDLRLSLASLLIFVMLRGTEDDAIDKSAMVGSNLLREVLVR